MLGWDRDEVVARTDLVALLEELSGPPARLGPSARWHCPARDHPDDRPSVTVFTDRRGVQRWRCWSGGHAGTVIDAWCAATGASAGEALTVLAERSAVCAATIGSPFRARERRPVAPRPPDPAISTYVAGCEKILWSRTGRPVLDWLVGERGLDAEVLRVNRVGADPGPSLFHRARGLPHGGPGAVFPVLDETGDVVYVQTR